VATRDAAALLPLAESIADGSPIDWQAAEAAATADDRAIIRELRVLADLATLHRTLRTEMDRRSDPLGPRRTAASPAIGSWAHLDLIERLGGGSYGEVYRAWDRQLECEVALKLLRADAGSEDPTTSRITAEARLLARVHHPNVVTVHGVAVHEQRVGLWMELVEGSTLEHVLQTHGPMSAGEASLVGIDLCRAIAAIHKAGLIHRDIKTQNVIRENGGRIVLMDLGTGRAIDRADELPDLAGTPLYLAPEIFEGAAASERTDLYSLGVLLYHLVTSGFPVRAASVEALQVAHATHTAVRLLRDARPDLPSAFVHIIDRAISPNPDERYRSAGELEADLIRGRDNVPPVSRGASAIDGTQRPPRFFTRGRAIALAAAIAFVLAVLPSRWLPWNWIAGVDPSTIRSIAVLPLVNMSGDQSQDYFADGMTEALIDSLAKLGQLRVISRTSIMQFKGTRQSLRDIAKTLNVDAILEGSVVKSGNRVRVSADLVHAATDKHVWVNSYDRDISDILALQSEVARAIARGVQLQVTPIAQAGFGAMQAVNPAAEDAYLKGRYFWNKRTDEGYQQALDYFRQAAAIEPSFARAYAGQADVYNLLPNRMAPSIAYPLAKDAANRAIQIDPSLGEAHTSLAFAAFVYDRDWANAEAEFKRAIEANPGYATAHQWYGDFLTTMGRFDEAVAQLNAARSLDPLSATIHTSLADSYYHARRFDEAITEYRAIMAGNDFETSGYVHLALALADKNLPHEARAVLDQWKARVSPSLVQNALDAILLAKAGDRTTAAAEAGALAARGHDIDSFADVVSWTFIVLGDRDRAFDLLTRAELTRAPALIWAKVDPVFDSVRADPRFTDLLRTLKLAP